MGCRRSIERGSPVKDCFPKAQSRELTAAFFVHDALQLPDISEQFDSAIDCGLFHVFSDADRPRYVQGLASILRPGGKLFLLCFSDQEPPGDGPRRISQDELQTAFAAGWSIESIEEARFETRPDLVDLQFSEGGPYAWFAVVQRM